MINKIYQFNGDYCSSNALTFYLAKEDGSASEFFTKERIRYFNNADLERLYGYKKVYDNED